MLLRQKQKAHFIAFVHRIIYGQMHVHATVQLQEQNKSVIYIVLNVLLLVTSGDEKQ